MKNLLHKLVNLFNSSHCCCCCGCCACASCEGACQVKITKSQLRKIIKEEIGKELKTEVKYSGNQLERRDETVKAILKELGLDKEEMTDKETYQYTYALRGVAQGKALGDGQKAMLGDDRFKAATGAFMKLKKELEDQNADSQIILDAAQMLTKESGRRLPDEDDWGQEMKITKEELRSIIKEAYTSQLLASAQGALQDIVDDTSNELSFEDSRMKEIYNALNTLARRADRK